MLGLKIKSMSRTQRRLPRQRCIRGQRSLASVTRQFDAEAFDAEAMMMKTREYR